MQNSDVLFSIIIPTYNSALTISKSIESILSQGFKQYEILIIDGMSTDDTNGVVAKYGINNSSIKWVSEKDKGVYDAMNKGINLASGNWLYFLGSDDYLYDNEVLSDLATAIANYEADFVYGNAIFLSKGERYGGEFDIIRLQTKQNICHQAIFYKKTLFDKLGKFNLNYNIAADWDFNIRCFRHPELVKKYIDRDIVKYNDETGLSSLPHEDAFYKELPIKYANELFEVKIENTNLINSREYKIGKAIYKALRVTGILSLVYLFKSK